MDPHGMGVFVYQKGAAFATEPVNITNAISTRSLGEKTAHYIANIGQEIKVREVPSLTKIAKIGPAEYGILSDMKFIPLNGDQVTVASDPSIANEISLNKVALQTHLSWYQTVDTSLLRKLPFEGKMYNSKT